MPSSKNYKRDYKQEARTESRERQEFRRERNQARRDMIKQGKVQRNDGRDVDHHTPLSLGGSNSLANLRVTDPHKNRSFPRNKDGSIKKRR